MVLYTIGSTQKTAGTFFGLLRHAGIQRLTTGRRSIARRPRCCTTVSPAALPPFLPTICYNTPA